VDGAVHGAACVFEFEVEVVGVAGEEVGDGELARLADAGAAFDDDGSGDGVHGVVVRWRVVGGDASARMGAGERRMEGDEENANTADAGDGW
jgi:hypothetical protein